MKEQLVFDDLFLDGEAVRDAKGKYLVKSQQGWEQYFAGSGKRLPTLAEYVTIIKQLDERNDSVALGSIRQDLRESALCTGTKIDYRTSNLPVDAGYLDVLVKDSAWQTALQDLLKQDVEETVDLLQRTSGKRPYIWTPGAYGRTAHPERAVWLNISSDRFNLDCYDNPISSGGRARGVRESTSVSELNVPISTAPKNEQSEILPAPESFSKPKVIHDSKELEWARRLLDGSAGGTVIDWKRH